MSSTGRGVDALGFYLTGGATGASNKDPDASLGGVITTTRRVLEQGFLLSSPIPAVRIDHAFAANGTGEGTLSVDSSGSLTWTPPGGSVGTAVTIAVGGSAVLAGSDSNKALRVYRESGLQFSGVSTVELVSAMNGVVGQSNLTSAQRVAGRTTYRALALKALGDYRVAEIRVWLPPVSGAQASWSVAAESPVAGSVQTIATESTDPTGLAFVAATSSATALVIPFVSAGEWVALWIRRVFPALGSVSPAERVDLAVSYMGAP